MDKPVCKYGASCYRKSTEHLKRFSHPGDGADIVETPSKRQKLAEPVSSSVDGPGASSMQDDVCLRVHPDDDDGASSTNGAETTDGTELPKDTIRRKFLVDLNDDFYLFWDFCKILQPSSPLAALKPTLGLELVGPYDSLAGRLDGVPWEKCVLHSRHFYDPPEMTTVLATRGRGGKCEGFHLGYFRDDNSCEQFLLVSNNSENCELAIEGRDIFSATRRLIQRKLQSTEEVNIKALKTLDSKLGEWQLKLKHVSKEDVKDLQRKRAKETVATTFNKLGIVVPYDKTTELGYRPLPMTNKELLKLLNRICSHRGNVKKQDEAFEPLQEIITFVQFANDECDYGMGLELGMDLFCFGDEYFHRTVEHLLPLAYELLGREDFAKVCRLHLRLRNRTPLDYAH